MSQNKPGYIAKLLNLIYRIMGPVILLYLFWLIGFVEIKNTLLKLTIEAIALIFLLKILATMCRLAKYLIFNPQISILKNCEIYLSAKIGGELSIIGHFSPLLNDEFRNGKTVRLLLLDRYLEILSTFIVAFICALLLITESVYYFIFTIFFSGCSLAALTPFFLKISWESKIKIINKAFAMSRKLHDYLHENGKVILYMLCLSILSSLIEFYVVYLIFDYINSPVNFAIVPIIWAVGGVVGYITFLSIGTAEITSLLLYSKLAKIPDSAIASMIIVAKVFITLSSLLVYAFIGLLKLLNRFFTRGQLLDDLHDRCINRD